MWDKRFDTDEYVYGTDPAAFLRATAGILPPASRVLSVADGEGRNSAYLAELGHDVVAMDAAAVGVAKARRLAHARGVRVNHHHAAIEDWDWAPQAFDAVVAIFINFADDALRARIFDGVTRTLRPGGLFLLHGYGPRQPSYGTGGPDDPALLYTLPMLNAAFPDWTPVLRRDYEDHISEGTGHHGQSHLIDFVVRKPGTPE